LLLSSYTKVYSVIYDSGSVPNKSIFSPRETSPSCLDPRVQLQRVKVRDQNSKSPRAKWSDKIRVGQRQGSDGDSNSHGARPVHLIITMIKWIRTSRLSIKNSLCRPMDRGSRFMFRVRVLRFKRQRGATIRGEYGV